MLRYVDSFPDHTIKTMKIKSITTKPFAIGYLVAMGVSIAGNIVSAQPGVSYTVSGTPGAYALDFTVNNATPGTSGFDIYFFGVLVDGVLSGSPSGYYGSYYSTIHTTEVSGPAYNWPFNNTWIDPTYARLPTGSTLSGFKVTITDINAPTSVQYFAFGYDAGFVYTGSGNQNLSSPGNSPLFVGYAVEAIPEPSIPSMLPGAWLLLLLSHRNRS
jgi:hypothetical protein